MSQKHLKTMYSPSRTFSFLSRSTKVDFIVFFRPLSLSILPAHPISCWKMCSVSQLIVDLSMRSFLVLLLVALFTLKLSFGIHRPRIADASVSNLLYHYDMTLLIQSDACRYFGADNTIVTSAFFWFRLA